MSNLEYLTEFFKKHNLSGKIVVNYLTQEQNDDDMCDIIFENGDVMTIDDVIFDIMSDLPEDMFSQWMKAKRQEDVSYVEWMKGDTHYMPENIDTSGITEFQNEVDNIIKETKDTINRVFELVEDDGSDYEEDEG